MKILKQRIATCKHTRNEVVQIKDGRSWLCLHNDTIQQDLEEVNKLKNK